MLRKISTAALLLLAFSLLPFLFVVSGFSAENQGEGFSINGVVQSTKGLPLENVRVGIKDSEEFVTTDREGRFTIPFKNPNQRFFQWDITIDKEGYLSSGAKYGPGSGNLSIILQAIPKFDSPEYQAKNQGSSFGINGFVRSRKGLPLENARVRIRGSKEFVTTDNEGRFTVPLSNPGQRLFQWIITAGKEGYVNSGARYVPGKEVVFITLQAIPNFDSPDYQMVTTSPAGTFSNNRGVQLQEG